MAEKVFKKLEDMLPELEDLEKKGIFTRNELRAIIKKRTEFEYKLERRGKEKEDFIRYLQYELSVDMLRKRRVRKLGLKIRYTEAERVIKKRMHFIFQRALKKFADDIKLWLQYVDFCKKMKSTKCLGRAFASMLQFHPRKANIWVLAAKTEFEENNNIGAARALMQQAIKVNQESPLLWREYCRLELLHVDKIQRRREMLCLPDKHDNIDVENASEDFLNNKIARIVYNKAIDAIPDSVEFRASFLPILRQFKNTEQNIEEVYESLHCFPDNPLAIELLAKKTVEEAKMKLKETDSDNEALEVADKDCFDRFLKSATEHQSETIWEQFAKALLTLVMESKTEYQASRRIGLLLDAFQNAEREAKITEDMYISWGECCVALDDMQNAVNCWSRATKNYPHSRRLWERYLKTKCGHANSKIMSTEFGSCLGVMKETDKPSILGLWIDCFSEHFPDKVKTVFEEALIHSKDMFDLTSFKYVEWMLNSKGAGPARKVYRRLSENMIGTPSLDFIKKGIVLENLRENPNADKIRVLYEKMISGYGEKNIDVWLDFIRFEMNMEETAADRIGRLYHRAIKILEDNLVADFVSQLSLIQAGN